MKETKKRGRPLGTPGGGRYGEKTKVVRVPERVANNIVEILLKFEEVKKFVEENYVEVEEKTSPRYERAKKILSELKYLLEEE